MVLAWKDHMIQKEHIKLSSIAALVDGLPELELFDFWLDLRNQDLHAINVKRIPQIILCTENQVQAQEAEDVVAF